MTSAVISLERYRMRQLAPPLVFVDMYQEKLAGNRHCAEELELVIYNCRQLIKRARARGQPVAFVAPAAGPIGWPQGKTRWIDGFNPQRNDMVFEPIAASCYSSVEFAEAMTDAGMRFLLAGFSGEGACLATLIDAARFGHRPGLIMDASFSQSLPGLDVDASHRALTALASRYAIIITTDQWLSTGDSRRCDLERYHEIQ